MRVTGCVVVAGLYWALACASTPASERGNAVAEESAPTANVRFVYAFCNDLAGVRHFYTDLLGLPEAAYNDEHGYLCYQCEGFQLMFFRPQREVEPLPAWADQPGYDGGTEFVTSWSIEIPEAAYAAVVERLQEESVEIHSPDPEWRVDSYWGFTVKDPRGHTVEVYAIPAATRSRSTRFRGSGRPRRPGRGSDRGADGCRKSRRSEVEWRRII
jgi:catechol 2,3-dioxygenase-like lactoylglutathione lyase family enzyme